MIAALLADGVTELLDVQHCADSLACLSAIQSLGAKVLTNAGGILRIEGKAGKIHPAETEINCGESGFALRALASVAALASQEITLTGRVSLLTRPMNFFENVFPKLDVTCKAENGMLPMRIKGPLHYRDVKVDGTVSSQFLSGLLMVYPFAGEDHVIEVHELKSRQYIDLTIEVLDDFGIKVRNEGYQKFYVPGNQQYKSFQGNIEGDWSSAAFMLVAGATAGQVTVENLNMNSFQPDKAITTVLKQCGAGVGMNNNSLSVNSPVKGKLQGMTQRNALLKPFAFDATGCPDLFPPLVALAACCEGVSEITGVERLFYKESNRALALQQEFSKLNENMVTVEGNKMMIRGGLKLNSAEVHSHNDHRIAMALAVAALNVEGGVMIDGCESVEKSYPRFFADLEKIKSAEK